MNIKKILLCFISFIFLFFSFIFGYFFENLFFKHNSENLLNYENTPTISAKDIQNYISGYSSQYIIYDTMYYTLSLNYMNDFLKFDDLNNYIYKLDKFDCDNYAISLMARVLESNYDLDIPYNFAFGICNQQFHVVNWFIDSNFTIRCIEPQNDTIFDCNLHNLCNLIII